MSRPTATRPDGIRRQNLRAVLGAVHRSGNVTRAELTRTLGLNRSTIGVLVADLVDSGLVSEKSPDVRSGAGRPSHVVGPREDGPYVIAVDVDVCYLEVAAVGLAGTLLRRTRVDYPTELVDPSYVVGEILRCARAFAGEIAPSAWPVGIGISVPGTVRAEDERVVLAPNLHWRDVALNELVRRELSTELPVVTANDADLGALAEHLRGSARNVDDMLFVCGRVGVGGGIITGGRPLNGARGLAGEIGHIVVDPSGPDCHCGNRGCLETFIGEAAILRRAGHAGRPGTQMIAEIIAAAAAGEPRATETMEYVAQWLGRGLATVSNILNPAVIVVGGFLTDVVRGYHGRVRSVFDDNMRAGPPEQIEIRLPGLGRDSALLGAAEMAFYRLLSDPAEQAARHRRTVTASVS